MVINKNSIYLARIAVSILLTYFVIQFGAKATHIRAGEITARRTSNLTLTFEFTFTGFRDQGSNIEFGDGTFDFGDGVTNERWDYVPAKYPLGNDVEMVEYKIVHTYQAPGSYIISYRERNRNDGIANMDNSVNTAFCVESMIVIDPFFGLNNTPILTVPPIDFAVVGGSFIHNPGAFDPDGDSLSYKFTVPQEDRGVNVYNYRDLNNPEYYDEIPYNQGNEAKNSTPTVTLDPVSGNLVWNAPGDVLNQREGDERFAEYNVAFTIEEWRYIPITNSWEPLGYVTRDMQIIVRESDNKKPTLKLPENICIEAGESVEEIIQGNDPDGDPVKIEAFGGPFEVDGTQANYSPNPAEFKGPPGFTNFTWQTQCGHVRSSPYEVQFKITDQPSEGVQLTNFGTFEITVVGPAPEGLTTNNFVGRSIDLEWDSYSCSNAEKMQVWRRVGSFDIEFDECAVGMPENAGYEMVDEINITGPGNTEITSYTDDNEGKGLAPGATYCYRLVATYPHPSGGVSYVSEEVCDTIILDVPAITNVDVLRTSETNGEIKVIWVPPYQINQTESPPSYKYDILRSEGFSEGDSYELIASQVADTTFIDTGLNTLDNSYHYYLKLYDGNNLYVDSSVTASSVKTILKPGVETIEVNWRADVPWSNTFQDYLYHYIYRDQVLFDDPDSLVLIDSVDVTQKGFSYQDEGDINGQALDEEIEYCYYVTTYGTYGNDLLPQPLINNAQIACAQPNDTIPPCAPPTLVLSEGLSCEEIIAKHPCGSNVYDQELSWEMDMGPLCEDDIVYYNIYYSSTGRESDYYLLGETEEQSFKHQNISSLKGCYRISAVDRSGNESEMTEEVCMDNCPVYILPNVFTPNNDELNDLFVPIGSTTSSDNSQCPRFIKSVDFTVFTRSGNEVYHYNSYENANGILINWNGRNKWGQDLPEGMYYYSADLEYDLLQTNDQKETLKGWIQILR